MTSRDLSSWERIEPIIEYAIDLPPGDRAIYLEAACGADLALRARIEGMLAAGEDPNGMLERSIADVAGPLMLEVDGPLPPAIPLGAMFGPWRVVRELGHGGMGEVFLAERADGQFAQTAALKVVRRGREHDPLLIRRFLEERRILASLAHPNVARLLDGGVTPANLPWFAMEFVDGRPLDQYCDDRKLDVPARLALMEQILGAVAYAHRNLLVHRDLKPSNIFVTDDGTVKLLDFGIAKLLGEESLSDPGLTIGYNRVMTPEYAAPEQVRGEAVTTATDIYALGAVLYQLLTGQRAHRFDKRTAAEIERMVCETDPEAAQSRRTRHAHRRPRLASAPCGATRKTVEPTSTRSSSRRCKKIRPGATRRPNRCSRISAVIARDAPCSRVRTARAIAGESSSAAIVSASRSGTPRGGACRRRRRDALAGARRTTRGRARGSREGIPRGHAAPGGSEHHARQRALGARAARSRHTSRRQHARRRARGAGRALRGARQYLRASREARASRHPALKRARGDAPTVRLRLAGSARRGDGSGMGTQRSRQVSGRRHAAHRIDRRIPRSGWARESGALRCARHSRDGEKTIGSSD